MPNDAALVHGRNPPKESEDRPGPVVKAEPGITDPLFTQVAAALPKEKPGPLKTMDEGLLVAMLDE